VSTTGSGFGGRRGILDEGVVVAADYRIDGLLGDGGMGIVYEATQLSLDKKVALKLVATELSEDSAFRERFRREGRLQAQIDHPHILDVYAAGESQYGLFLAMRLVRGPTLKDLITRGDLETMRAVRFLGQVGQAIDAAHAVGLVHRDIKPQNVLIDERREHSYLADFGVTKALGKDTGLTRAGDLVGTFDYMAPEQFRGHEATERSDIYALGAVVYEAFVGVVPFPRPTEGAVMYAHLADPVPSVRERRPGLPAEIDKIIDRAMAKHPEERYKSAAELAYDLMEVISSISATETPMPVTIPVAPDTSVKTRVDETAAGEVAPPRETNEAKPERTPVVSPQPTASPTAPETTLSPADAVRRAPEQRPADTTEAREFEEPSELRGAEETRPEPAEPAVRPAAAGTRASPAVVVPDVPGGERSGSETRGTSDGAPSSQGTRLQPVTAMADQSQAVLPYARRAERPTPGRRSVLLGAAIGILGLATIGFFVGHGQSGDRTAASPPAHKVLRSGPMTLSLPAAWRATQGPSIPGFDLTNRLAAAPASTSAAGGIVAGKVATAWPSFLPAAFRRRLGGSAVPPHDIVRLGDLEAFRYPELHPRGFGGVVTVYAVPEPGATSLIACHAAAAGAPVLEQCAGIAASLRLAGARPYSLIPSRAYARALNGAMLNLQTGRSRGLRSIGTAKTRASEAGAATAIAAAYRAALRRVRSVSPTPFVRPAHERIAAALKQVMVAYAALASAANTGNQTRYDGLRRLVRTREAMLAREVSRLRALGFRG
jgi:serine/threonine protein kinase